MEGTVQLSKTVVSHETPSRSLANIWIFCCFWVSLKGMPHKAHYNNIFGIIGRQSVCSSEARSDLPRKEWSWQMKWGWPKDGWEPWRCTELRSLHKLQAPSWGGEPLLIELDWILLLFVIPYPDCNISKTRRPETQYIWGDKNGMEIWALSA